jgi:16S rRNA (guanine(527)-N(7))-methyltransferase RsmG
MFHVEHAELVSRETEQKLRAYQALLLTWNRRINLIGRQDEATFWQRHVLDCVQVAGLLPSTGDLADLGSGGGLPGLVIAIMRPAPIHLVESDKRKAAFLMEASRSLGLANVAVHSQRIEEAELPPLTGLTARALAALPVLLSYAARLLTPEGVAVFQKGRTAEAELTDAASHWLMRVERFPSRTDPEATLLRLSEIRPAGA